VIEVGASAHAPEAHPLDHYIRKGRIPHIWCPGCGLGISMICFIRALEDKKIPLDKLVVVSGIGCTGRVAGYLNVDSYHTTHGRAIPFATGLKMANPDLTVVVYSGDGDLFAIGGNHFIHAARRNVDLKVICVNNFNYGMTGGQFGPTTPIGARTSTTSDGNREPPFNLPFLAKASGAVYVARWTTLHVRKLKHSIEEILDKKGFSFVEVISPCPTAYGSMNKQGSSLEIMRFYRDSSEVRHGIDPGEASIGLKSKIIVGKFVDIEKPVFSSAKSQS
jgi:2-oxoglutarate/2-oxoacid ferredoxin oxidoreductase subunit beta